MLLSEDSQTTPSDLPGQARKVLCYSPYNLWELHGMWETTILHALKLRGAEVSHVLCDALYRECDVFWTAANPRHRLACQQCQAKVTNLALTMGMDFEWLGRYLSPEERRTALDWAASLKEEDYLTASYGDWLVGEWVRGSVHSHLRTSSLDLSQPQERQVYRGYLESGLIACFGLSRLLDEYRPDVLLQFNGRMSSTRVAFELARRRGVRVVCHERGMRNESIRLSVNTNCLDLQPIKDIWRDWGEVPLTRGELDTVSRFMIGRQYGKDLSWKHFSPVPQNLEELRRQFGFPPGQMVWVLFTSSDDEVISVKEWGGPFPSQMQWVQETIRYVARAKDLTLIIRVHPNTGGKNSTGKNLKQLQEFEELRGELPPQVHLVLPDDQVSSYSLMDLADLGLVYISSAGLEMACKGKHVVAAAGCYISDLPFVMTIKTVEEYPGLLESLRRGETPFPPWEIQRLAHRFAYSLFFRNNIPFPLVKMPTLHTGQLTYNALEALLPGRDPNLDRICDILLKGRPVCPPPEPRDFQRSEEEETACFNPPRPPAGPAADTTGKPGGNGEKPGRAGNAPPAFSPGDGDLPAPTVSVIIPAYNMARFIKETLDSVLQQPYQDLEIIVVDDGSTDDTAQAVRECGDRVKYLYKENDGFLGPGGAINLGLKHARGRFIHGLDGDDLVTPVFYERVLAHFDQNPSLGAVSTDAHQIDEKGRITGLFKLGNFKNMEEFRLESLHHNPIVSSSMVVRRECYEKVGGRRPEFEIADDYDLWLRIGEHFDIALIPEPLIKYRFHGDGISRCIDKTRQLIKKLINEYLGRNSLEYFFPILKVADSQENRVEAYLQLGDILLHCGFYEETITAVQQAMDLDKNSSLGHKILGVAYYHQGKRTRAKRHFLRALEIDPGDEATRENLEKIVGIPRHSTPLGPSPASPGSRPRRGLKILLAAHAFLPHSFAGTELYTHDLARALERRGHLVRVLYAHMHNPDVQANFSLENDFYQDLPVTKVTGPSRAYFGVRHAGLKPLLKAFFRENPVDLVHIQHLLGLSVSFLEVLKELEIPTVLTLNDFWFLCQQVHLMNPQGVVCAGPETMDKCVQCKIRRCSQVPEEHLPHLFFGQADHYYSFRRAIRLPDLVLCPSKFLMDTFQKYDFVNDHLVHLPQGANLFQPLPPTARSRLPVIFSYLGTICHRKGVDLLVDAFCQIDTADAELHLYGDPVEQLYSDRLIQTIPPGKKIFFHGKYVPGDLPRILAATDVAVVPSRGENYPFVLREILHARVPVVAAAIAGIPEIVEDGVNGLLFEGNNARDLAAKLALLIKEPELIETLRAGIKPMKSLDQDAADIEGHYWQVFYRRAQKKAAMSPGDFPGAADALQSAKTPAGAAETPPPPPKEVRDVLQSPPLRGLSSIIIPVFNNLSLTSQCLESIWDYTDVPHEIIVVDNGSTDGTRDYLNRVEAERGVRVISNRTNLGFAKASNQGAHAAQGEYLVFLNNDTIVQPGWLQELEACARKDPKIGAVGARLLFPDDTIQHAGVAFTKDKLVHHIYQRYDKDHPAVNKEREFQAVTAACALVKRDLFFGVGGFDDSYRNGFEDVDLCFKLRQQGYRIVYNPRAVVYHLESKTPGRHDQDRENSWIFKSRWQDVIIGDDQQYYQEDDITIEVLGREGNVTSILAHDNNDNFFWREAVQYRQEGLLDQAEACYLRALQFNPFDPRKFLVAQELEDLYETQGKHSQIEILHQMVPGLTRHQSLPGGAGEVRESAGVV